MVELLVTLLFGLSHLAVGAGDVTKTCKVVAPHGPHSHSHVTHCRTYRNGVRVPNERLGGGRHG
ncbi:MAG: hypothetical protein ACRDMH_11090 [Solirubrobacterales bacterium]